MCARLIGLDGLAPQGGLCRACPLPTGESSEEPHRSSLRFFENGREVDPAHTIHDEIRQLGGGRSSHWADRLYLSEAEPGRRPDQCRYTAPVESAGQASARSLLAAAAGLDAERLTPEIRYAWGERIFAAFAPDIRLAEFGRSFFHDRAFIADYGRFDRLNYRSLDRKFTLKELLRVALRRPGALAECGVFRGASAFLMAQAIHRDGGGRHLHLFDSSAGLSVPGALDGAYWAAGSLACSRAEVAANLAEFADLISFREGWIPQGFDDVTETHFCFVHIDVDLCQPTRDALEFFYPRMVAGGLIVCNDYGCETCPGARHAMDAFFAERPEQIVHLPTGQGFVVIEPQLSATPAKD